MGSYSVTRWPISLGVNVRLKVLAKAAANIV